MSVVEKCPSCGLKSADIRCPRCNALKVVGCTGSCGVCGSSSACKTTIPAPPTRLPSEDAVDDAEHPGTPLER